MLSQNEIDALLRELHGYEVAGKKDRADQVRAILGQSAPVVEVAADPVAVETAVKRGPGRPRKGD
jgi:hypothetical protein